MPKTPFIAALLLAAACGSTPEAAPPVDELVSSTGVVVSAHHLSSEAGASVLAKGGNAIDAAVATAFSLAVTYPAAGNIGGGGFMVVRMADGSATTFDYREKAPLKATPTMYLDAKGEIAWAATDSGWRSPGVPGTVRGLAMAHARFGKLPWRDVVMPAVVQAEQGFAVSAPFAEELNWAVEKFLAPFPASVAAYGKPGDGKYLKRSNIQQAIRPLASARA